jgi:hypothetical protein
MTMAKTPGRQGLCPSGEKSIRAFRKIPAWSAYTADSRYGNTGAPVHYAVLSSTNTASVLID